MGVSPVTIKPGSTVTRQKQRGREARGKKDHLKQSYKDLSCEKKKMKEESMQTLEHSVHRQCTA